MFHEAIRIKASFVAAVFYDRRNWNEIGPRNTLNTRKIRQVLRVAEIFCSVFRVFRGLIDFD
jgi:hypothetical protein